MSEREIDQSAVEKDLDKTRIRIIGARAVWATWAAQQAERAADDMEAAAPGQGRSAGDAEWRGLSVIDDALRRAETELETAIQLLEDRTGMDRMETGQ